MAKLSPTDHKLIEVILLGEIVGEFLNIGLFAVFSKVLLGREERLRNEGTPTQSFNTEKRIYLCRYGVFVLLLAASVL